MTLQQAFVKTDRISDLENIILDRLNSPPDEPNQQPDVGVPNSYDSTLALDKKRKVAISNVVNGWVSILESNEVNDYKMLLNISTTLATEVFAIVLYDVSGSYGFCNIIKGTVTESNFSEEDPEIMEHISEKLRDKNIALPICKYYHVASRQIPGWKLLKALR